MVRAFRKKIYDYFRAHGRELPWRKTTNPYRILVSEIMLQQTQVDRVIEKYTRFIAAFPDIAALANAPVNELLGVWQGMGYNRRALALKALAQQVVDKHRGKLPSNPEQLISLPGIGNYTAGAVQAFAFNKPVVFMDTNIRRVYIHHFFEDQEQVHDDDLLLLVEQTLDRKDPCRWYNALMDYGSMLRKEIANPNRRSVHYVKQSPFDNSNRQVRGRILKLLVKTSRLTAAAIVKQTGMDADRVKMSLSALEKEGFIRMQGRVFTLA